MRWLDNHSDLTGLDIVLAREERRDASIEAKQPPVQHSSAWAIRLRDWLHRSRTAAKRERRDTLAG